MVTVAAAPDAQQPQRDCAMSVAEDTQLQHLEALLVERLMNRSSSAAPRPCSPPQLPDSAPRHQPPHNKREKKIKKRKKRPRSDEKRMEAFRQAVAQKAKAAQDAALAIATVRPRQASPPPRAPRLSPRSPPSHVPTLRVKQLPSSLPSRRNETAATKAAAERVFVNAVEFVNSHRTEVGDFGSEALHRSDRRKYQMAKLIKLGCRPPKNQKMPIGLLQKRRKREKLTALKQKQRDLETGMLLRIKRKTKRK